MTHILQEVIKKYIKPDLDAEHVLKFLKFYGYVSNNYTVAEFAEGIAVFKDVAGIEEIGIGDKSFRVMYLPRCGVSDIEFMTEDATNPNRWGLSELTYFIKGRDTDLTADDWDGALKRALTSWSKVCRLLFKQVYKEKEANLVFSIGSGNKDNFDGQSGTLAWAYLPPSSSYKGQLLCLVDTSETWIVNPTVRGILLENVLCHEIGHLLGLYHSKVREALLAPYYSAGVKDPRPNDDIPRIQKLYGKPTVDPIPDPIPDPTPVPPTGSQRITLNLDIKGSIENVQIPGYRVYKQS